MRGVPDTEQIDGSRRWAASDAVDASSAAPAEVNRTIATSIWRVGLRSKLLGVLALLLLVATLLLLPPLLSLNRYERRISTSIGLSLGRPVHLDHVALNLLPLPSFTLTNFVVEEAPEFGYEPIIRSNSVQATLRVSSLWRRRIEFSRISFREPSVNLVHAPNGGWNVESVLLEAARIEAAPTGQAEAGEAPRFPYIEAKGARINFKEGIEKKPFSLVDANFALWLPRPQEWRMRLDAQPQRTDTYISDAGAVQMEATLGHAASLGAVPVTLDASWRGAPLGEASRIVFGQDVGLRGELNLSANLHGTLGQSEVHTRLRVKDLRRSEFVPVQSLQVDVECAANATELLHSFDNVRCGLTSPGAKNGTVAVTGTIPDIRQLRSASGQVGAARVPGEVLLSWLRVASASTPPQTALTGILSGSLSRDALEAPAGTEPLCCTSRDPSGGRWSGQAEISGVEVRGSALGTTPVVFGDIILNTEVASAASSERGLPHARTPSQLDHPEFVLRPTTVTLDARNQVMLDGSFDATGYSLHLSGTARPERLMALGAALPQFGDGLAEMLPRAVDGGAVRLDLVAHRGWGGPQVWTDLRERTSSAAGLRPRGGTRRSRARSRR